MILVTGGLGFIGSHIVRALMGQKKDVLVYDLLAGDELSSIKKLRFPEIEELNLIQGDLCDLRQVESAIRENNINQLIHVGAMSFIPDTLENPYKAFQINLNGTLNILEAARRSDIEHIVHISTSSVYGEIQYVPVDEKHPLKPKDVYGGSKLAAETAVEAYASSYGLETTIIRPTNVYGPGDLYNRVVKIFIENALLGKPLSLQGGGLQRRDFTYVKDTTRGILATLNNRSAIGETFNISYGEDHSIREVADIISELIPGTTLEVTAGRRIDVQKRRLDTSKAQRILGYKPEYDLRSGIKEYIKWASEIYFSLLELEVKNTPTSSL